MPNFWSTTTQKIYELFKGPKTRDPEFDSKVTQLKTSANKMKSTKSIYDNFYTNTRGYKVMCNQIYTDLSSVYDDTSPYWPIINEIIILYKESERLYEDLLVRVREIERVGQAWDVQYETVRIEIDKREEARRKYDHYDDKYQKLLKRRDQKNAHGDVFSVKEQEYFERVNYLNNLFLFLN